MKKWLICWATPLEQAGSKSRAAWALISSGYCESGVRVASEVSGESTSASPSPSASLLPQRERRATIKVLAASPGLVMHDARVEGVSAATPTARHIASRSRAPVQLRYCVLPLIWRRYIIEVDGARGINGISPCSDSLLLNTMSFR